MLLVSWSARWHSELMTSRFESLPDHGPPTHQISLQVLMWLLLVGPSNSVLQAAMPNSTFFRLSIFSFRQHYATSSFPAQWLGSRHWRCRWSRVDMRLGVYQSTLCLLRCRILVYWDLSLLNSSLRSFCCAKIMATTVRKSRSQARIFQITIWKQNEESPENLMDFDWKKTRMPSDAWGLWKPLIGTRTGRGIQEGRDRSGWDWMPLLLACH